MAVQGLQESKTYQINRIYILWIGTVMGLASRLQSRLIYPLYSFYFVRTIVGDVGLGWKLWLKALIRFPAKASRWILPTHATWSYDRPSCFFYIKLNWLASTLISFLIAFFSLYVRWILQPVPLLGLFACFSCGFGRKYRQQYPYQAGQGQELPPGSPQLFMTYAKYSDDSTTRQQLQRHSIYFRFGHQNGPDKESWVDRKGLWHLACCWVVALQNYRPPWDRCQKHQQAVQNLLRIPTREAVQILMTSPSASIV